MRVRSLMTLLWQRVVVLWTVIVVAGCGEPMEFQNAGSNRALVEDQQACDRELQSPAAVQYRKGQLDPWQVCVEKKGWKWVDRPGAPSASVKS